MDTNERERFNAFATNNIINNRDDILWGIAVGFDLALHVQEYAQALGDDFDFAALEHDHIGNMITVHMHELWEQRAAEKLERKWDRIVQRVRRRAAYADASEIIAKANRDGTMSLRFDTAMACMGLMAEILNHRGVAQDEPVVMNLLNRLPQVKDEKGRDTSQQVAVPVSEADNFASCGYELYQLKTLWNRNIGELWDIMEACLPAAIDRGSYHRRLRAPLIPGGYLPETTVRVGELHVDGKSLKADGSGWYDPHHETMQGLVQEYGPVAFQFTAINPDTGHFFKGIVYPMEGMNDGLRAEHVAGIQFDHLQVKGRKKAEHKAMAKVSPREPFMLDGVHIGIMKAKTTIGKVAGCFETLENIGPNPAHYPRGENSKEYRLHKVKVMKLIASLTRDAVDEIGELGPQGLLGRATRDDPHLRRLAEFIALANAQGAGINPLSIPILASKLQESLSRAMWTPANGAGINGKYPMVIIDNTLKPGTCVIAGHKPGTEIACWRFPTILAQGLLVLKVVGGKRHHRVDDKVVRNVIYMHPHDITTCQQGDDDGDEVGISTDPRVIELFSHKIDNGIYHIEPASEKLPHLANSDAGREYLRKNPMGPVGKVTIMRAALLATGRLDYARAFSVLIQEAIDSAKNLVRMTNPHRAANLKNWYKDRNGEYHVHYRCGGGECLCAERTRRVCPNAGQGYLTNNWLSETAGEFDMDVVEEAYEAEIKAAGCIKVVKAAGGGTKVIPGWPLGWRTQARVVEFDDGTTKEARIRKAVALDNWKPWQEKQDGEFSNLVHLAHNMARLRWQQWHNSFKPQEQIPTVDVLLQILKRLGSPLQPLDITWAEYSKDLRKRSGLEEYGAQMKRIRSQASRAQGNTSGPMDEQSRLAKIDNIRAHLELELAQLTAQELLTIWVMELTPTYWYADRKAGGRVYVQDRSSIPEGKKSWQANKPNYAFQAVTSKHSAIMNALGMEASEACGWFTERRLTQYVGWCRNQPDSYKALSKIVRENKGHLADVHDGNGQHVHLAECPECTERLKTALVRSIRADRTAGEQAAAKTLVSTMNMERFHAPIHGAQVEDAEQIDQWVVDDNDPFA